MAALTNRQVDEPTVAGPDEGRAGGRGLTHPRKEDK